MITEYRIVYGEREIVIEIVRSQRKSVGMVIRDCDRAILRIPYWLSDDDLKKIINDKQKWIIDKCENTKVSERISTGATDPNMLTAEEIEKIKEKFCEKIKYFSSKMGVSANKVSIRNQKTRWGSCSAKKNLNFNYQLYYLPDRLMDYVVIHELAHIRHMDHSKEFWAEVEIYCPDYKERRDELKNYRLID